MQDPARRPVRKSEQSWKKNPGSKMACGLSAPAAATAARARRAYVWVNREEIKALAAKVELALSTEFEKQYVRKVGIRKSLVEYANGDCVFFDPNARKCTVYEARPRQCRTWPFWQSNVATKEAWKQTCEFARQRPRQAAPGRADPASDLDRQALTAAGAARAVEPARHSGGRRPRFSQGLLPSQVSTPNDFPDCLNFAGCSVDQ